MESQEDKLDRVKAMAEFALPFMKEINTSFAQNDGRFKFPSDVGDLITEYNLSWHELYLNNKELTARSLVSFFGVDEIKELSNQNILPKFQEKLEILDKTFDEKIKSEEDMDRIAEDSNPETVTFFLNSIAASFFDTISRMYFGKSMCRLVEESINGSDESLFLAIQVDKSVIGISYFVSRINRAHLCGERSFLANVGKSIHDKISLNARENKELSIVLAFLHDEGLLNIEIKKLMALCKYLNIYDSDDDGSLRTFRNRFRKKVIRHETQNLCPSNTI